MAVPTKGNVTNAKVNMSGSSKTISGHNQVSGDDRLLIVLLTSTDQRNHTSLTYGGQALTRYTHVRRDNLSSRMSFWYLTDPPTGANNTVVGFSGGMYNPISISIRSFKDCGGVGEKVAINGNSARTSSPKTTSITVEEDSLIVITTCANVPMNSTSGQQIPTGTNQSFVSHSTTKKIAVGAISSNAGHSAGAVSCRAVASQSGQTITLDLFEIKGLGGGGGGETTDNSDFFIMF